MTTTTNYGYTVVVGSDTPVNIQNDIAPNFTAIDTDLKAVSDSSITVATHTVAGTVHNLVRTDADRNVLYFVATGDMAAGDTFTVDGVTVTARLVNGESLATGSFKINNNVFGILVGTVLNLYVPGATATASGTTYDNTGSGLTATNVQDAIDEVLGDIPTSLPATSITYNNTLSGLTATDVQYAIDEVNAKVTPTTISITTDGAQTYGQLFTAIKNQVDFTKVTPNAYINMWGGILRIENISSGSLEFAKARNGANAWNIQTITLGASCTFVTCTTGSYSDNTNSIPGAGNIITFAY